MTWKQLFQNPLLRNSSPTFTEDEAVGAVHAQLEGLTKAQALRVLKQVTQDVKRWKPQARPKKPYYAIKHRLAYWQITELPDGTVSLDGVTFENKEQAIRAARAWLLREQEGLHEVGECQEDCPFCSGEEKVGKW